MLNAANRQTKSDLSEFGLSHALAGFAELAKVGVSTVHRDGALLFREGEHARGVHLLLDGTAKVSMSSANGKAMIIRIARKGDLLGINATVVGVPYAATAQALKQCRALFIPRNDFLVLHTKNDEIRDITFRALGRYVSALLEAMRRLILSETAAEKLADLLVNWCDEFGVIESNGIRLAHGLTQADVAQMIGASRETVTRLLSKFTRRGLIRVSGNSLFIYDRKGIESIASSKTG